jgi:hypothetical protein
MVFFSFVMIAVNLPLYWVIPQARVRYALPVGPFAAIVIAGFFQFYLDRSGDDIRIPLLFQRTLKYSAFAALVSAIAIPSVMLLMKLHVSAPVIVLLLLLLLLGFFAFFKNRSFQFKTLPVYIILFTGLFWMISGALDVQFDSAKDYHPPKIAHEINSLLPEDVHTVYEFGSNGLIDVTCYLKKTVIRVNTFADIQSIARKERGVYFVSDTEFPDRIRDNDRQLFVEGIQWQKVYAKKLRKGSGEIVLGYLL